VDNEVKVHIIHFKYLNINGGQDRLPFLIYEIATFRKFRLVIYNWLRL
jgi:hypothetical protein